jgi:hypothetical protein
MTTPHDNAPEPEPDDDQYGIRRPYDGWEGHWAGDGSGMDDFADYNANEGGDY